MFQKPLRTARRKLLNPHIQESTDGVFRNQMISTSLSKGQIAIECPGESEPEMLFRYAGN